jgi:Tetracyclin repressor-like, C-terminal domain
VRGAARHSSPSSASTAPSRSGFSTPELPPDVFTPYADMFGARFTPPVADLFVASWTRLYGIVAMAVFGHLTCAMTDVEPLFALELARTLQQLAR